MDQQRGRPVLVHFWDACQPNSLRMIPWMEEWHRRYSDAGLRVIAVHTPGSPLTAQPEVVEAAVSRLSITHPVVLDPDGEIWSFYGVGGYPTRYLWDGELRLVDLHPGEGEYAAGERLIQELLGVEDELTEPGRPEEEEGAVLAAPTASVDGLFSGPYAAGGVWVVANGTGSVKLDDRSFAVDGPVALELLSHGAHSEGELAAEVEGDVEILSTVFTPGVIPTS